MNVTFMRQVDLLWKFLGIFQTPPLRCMHAALVVLVFLQFVSSSGMSMLFLPFSEDFMAYVSNCYHITAGLSIVALTLSMTAYSFSQRGLRRYFPYLWGDVARIKKDLQDSLHGKLPAPTVGGLATSVQGLGFGALWLTVFSGLTWFVLWQMDTAAADYAVRFHKSVVSLLVLYFIGHGGMAFAHFVLWQSKVVKK